VIQHVVLMKFTEPSDAAEAQRRLAALDGQVPALLSLRVGLDVTGPQAAYDLSLVTTHDSLAGLEAYRVDPLHQEFLAWAGPRLAARAAVDSAH
jgi:hypothetical protein